jgi:hypothetical protein
MTGTDGRVPPDGVEMVDLGLAEPPHRGRGTQSTGANRDQSRRRSPPPSPSAHLAGRAGGFEVLGGYTNRLATAH